MAQKEVDSLAIGPTTEKFRSILVFGPPGSGKGTVSRNLSISGGHCHVSSGDIFRSLSPESPAGRIFHQYAHKGLLVPDDVTVKIWRYYVDGLIATNRYFPQQQLLLLDGVPRTAPQTGMFDAHVDIAHIIVLDIENREELFRRMRRRAKIEGRMDDIDTSVLETRYEVYQKETAKVLSHYPSSLISRFNADQRPLEVLRDILVELSDILSAPVAAKRS